MPNRRSDLRVSIQLNRIIFQIVDGNMIISATRHVSEKPRKAAVRKFVCARVLKRLACLATIGFEQTGEQGR
jgi:hypothetical protein